MLLRVGALTVSGWTLFNVFSLPFGLDGGDGADRGLVMAVLAVPPGAGAEVPLLQAGCRAATR
jgi:hypothetical protein